MAAIVKRYVELPTDVQPWQFLLGRDPYPLPAEDEIINLPTDILELGHVRPNKQIGDRLEVPSVAEPELVQRLRANDFNFSRDDDLVKSTCDDEEPHKELRNVLQAKKYHSPKEA